MGHKLDVLLCRTARQTAKLKTLLGLTVSRLAVLRNQRRARCSHARGDVAELLLLGHQDRALLRAEQVIKEQNMLDAFVIIEGYCHLLTERAILLQRLTECPEELREAISGLVFAASRCGDLPELQKARHFFTSKFGKEFTNAAVELRNNCGVNPKLIQKLSTRQPSLESKVRVTKEIATEKGIVVDIEGPLAEEVDPSLSQSKKKSHPESNPKPDLSELGEERFSATGKQQYKDAAAAAQAAFESAAFAAAAARVAVELSRSESQGKGPDDQRGSNNESTHHGQDYSSESEEELFEEHKGVLPSNDSTGKPLPRLEKSPSASSSDSGEVPVYERKSSFAASSIISGPAKQDERKTMFDKSDNETEELVGYKGHGFEAGKLFNEAPDEGLPIKHKPSYLHPPYRKGNPVKDEMGMGLGLRSGDHHVNYYSDGRSQAENLYIDTTKKLQMQRSTAGQRPVSVRTRRGL